MTFNHLSLPTLLLACSFAAVGQDATPSAPAPPDVTQPVTQPGQTQTEPPPPDKRIFGVLPNYRTANATSVYMPITPRTKLTIASKDSFDYPLLAWQLSWQGMGN